MYNLFSIFVENSCQFKMIESFIIALCDWLSIHENFNWGTKEDVLWKKLKRWKHSSYTVCIAFSCCESFLTSYTKTRHGKGQDYIAYNINETVINLKTLFFSSLPFFHAVRGAKNTSTFHKESRLFPWKVSKYFL